MHAAAGDDERPASPTRMTSAAPRQRGGLGHRPGDVPDPLGEQLDRPVVGLGLHVLRAARSSPRRSRPGRSAPASRRAARTGSCSGRQTRSKNRDTGRNASLTDTSCRAGARAPAAPAAPTRVAKMSPGSSSTGSRLMVASAAPVSMLVAPGPIDAVHGPGLQPVAHAGRSRPRCAPSPARCGPGGRAARPARRSSASQQRLADAGHVAVAEDAEAAGEELLLDAVALARTGRPGTARSPGRR